MQPPSGWVAAAPESRELLALCLRKLKLSKVRIVDASFIWTEPHSRRVKIKLTVQDEVQSGILLQQSFEVTYVVAYQQCPECAKSYTANVWRACVQVRQKVLHKRTFLYLEQVILKHGAHRETINIKEAKEGIDFFFSARNQAEKFVDFLNSVTPVRVKKSQELISEDIHTSTKSIKFTFSVELVPISKDDLVALPLKLARQIGNIHPLVLCHRVGTAVSFLDPATLQTADLSAPVYWRAPFAALAGAQNLVEFIVMDIEPTGKMVGRWHLAEATVARSADLGINDQTYFTRTHLGAHLRVGDTVLGYMLTGTNFNSAELDAIENSHAHADSIPDVVLVRKHNPDRHRNRNRKRRQARSRGAPSEAAPSEMDHDDFMRDIEDDPEMQAAHARTSADDEMSGVIDQHGDDDGEDDDDDDDGPVEWKDVVERFENMKVQDA